MFNKKDIVKLSLRLSEIEKKLEESEKFNELLKRFLDEEIQRFKVGMREKIENTKLDHDVIKAQMGKDFNRIEKIFNNQFKKFKKDNNIDKLRKELTKGVKLVLKSK